MSRLRCCSPRIFASIDCTPYQGNSAAIPIGFAVGRLGWHEATTVNVAQIEELDNETMNARCSALISRYWARQGFVIELSSSQGAPLRSNLQPNGLPADYSGEDAIPINTR